MRGDAALQVGEQLRQACALIGGQYAIDLLLQIAPVLDVLRGPRLG